MKDNLGIILAIVTGVVFVIPLLVFLVFLIRKQFGIETRKERQKREKREMKMETEISKEKEAYKRYLAEYNKKKNTLLGKTIKEYNQGFFGYYRNYYRTETDFIIAFDQKPREYTVQTIHKDFAVNDDHAVYPAQPGEFEIEKKIPLDQIMFWRVTGDIQYTTSVNSRVSDNSVNLSGAVVGGILAGGAGAVIGSRVGTEPVKIDSTTEEHDSRKIEVTMIDGSLLEFPYHYIDGFNVCIHDKEHEYVRMSNQVNKDPGISTETDIKDSDSDTGSTEQEEKKEATKNGAQFSAADEILKFKELLDKGIITQEEFDMKKKQLLGL